MSYELKVSFMQFSGNFILKNTENDQNKSIKFSKKDLVEQRENFFVASWGLGNQLVIISASFEGLASKPSFQASFMCASAQVLLAGKKYKKNGSRNN